MDFAHLARLAECRRVRRQAIRAGCASTATGNTSGSTGSWPDASASATRRSATADQHGDHLDARAGVLARQPAEPERELRHEHHAPAPEHVQPVHRARDDRVAGELPDQVRPGVGHARRVRASSIPGATAGRPELPDAVAHVHARSRSARGSSWTPSFSFNAQRRAATSISRASARSRYSIDPVTGVRDSVADEGTQLGDDVDDVRHAAPDLRLQLQELVPHQPTAEQLPAAGLDLRSRDAAS